MSDTPETDKLITDWIQGDSREIPDFVLLARRLERERNAARQLAIAFHRDQVELLLKLKAKDQLSYALANALKERDEARAQNAKLCIIVEKIIPDIAAISGMKALKLIAELNQLKEGAK